jgi:hypothetical protein
MNAVLLKGHGAFEQLSQAVGRMRAGEGHAVVRADGHRS